MEENLKKSDWTTARDQYATLLVNELIKIDGYRYMLKLCEDKIKEFPDDDPMPDDMKELAEVVKND